MPTPVVDGRTAVTDAEGRFSSPDYLRCELDSPECLARRLRVEKQGYETREESTNSPYFLPCRKHHFVHSDESGLFPLCGRASRTSTATREWEQSPEGQAYLEAAAADRAAGYTTEWDENYGPLEVAASVCAVFAYYDPRSNFTRDALREQPQIDTAGPKSGCIGSERQIEPRIE